MTSFKETILAYSPNTEQEKQDKKQMLAYIDLFDDVLTRNNTIAHFSSSAFIINKEHTKTLFIYHKIYQSWCWTGGHVDGDDDFIGVALKEAKEETGLEELILVSEKIASLDILPVIGHFKNGKWVSSHQHLSVAYVFEADEKAPLTQNVAETNGLKWIPFTAIPNISNEKEMHPIYGKLLNFISDRRA